MSLVQYDSSSDSEEENSKAPINSNTNSVVQLQRNDSHSIIDFLPPPKNREPIRTTISKELSEIGGDVLNSHRQSQEIGGNAKSAKIVTSFVPSSVRDKQLLANIKAKAKRQSSNESDDPVKWEPKLELFKVVENKPRKINTYEESAEIRPTGNTHLQENPQEEVEDKEEKSSSLKRPLEDAVDQEEIKDFNVSDFYEKNFKLKATGQLQENKRLHLVKNHKNQLSALIKNAKQDEDVLKEKFEQQKERKKERGGRYGW